MRPSETASAAPMWAKCTAGMISVSVFPAHVIALWYSGNPYLLMAIPFSAKIASDGLDYVMRGRARKSGFTLIANFLDGKFNASTGASSKRCNTRRNPNSPAHSLRASPSDTDDHMENLHEFCDPDHSFACKHEGFEKNAVQPEFVQS